MTFGERTVRERIDTALLALSYLLRTEPEPADRAEPAPTEVRYD